MKTFLTIVLIMLIPGMLHAQVKDTDSFFKEYSGVKGYKTVILSQKMIQMSVDTDTFSRSLLRHDNFVPIYHHLSHE